MSLGTGMKARIVWRSQYCGGSFTGIVMGEAYVDPGEDLTPHVIDEFKRRGLGTHGPIEVIGIDNYRLDLERWSGEPTDRSMTYRDDFEGRQRERDRLERLDEAHRAIAFT